jgi:hypothetical protein
VDVWKERTHKRDYLRTNVTLHGGGHVFYFFKEDIYEVTEFKNCCTSPNSPLLVCNSFGFKNPDLE